MKKTIIREIILATISTVIAGLIVSHITREKKDDARR